MNSRLIIFIAVFTAMNFVFIPLLSLYGLRVCPVLSIPGFGFGSTFSLAEGGVPSSQPCLQITTTTNAYRSCERGTNENLNGLIRQYFPKKTDFSKVTKTQVREVEWLLNNRPRKKLNYLTPFEAYYGYCPYPKYWNRPRLRDWKKQYELQKAKKLAQSNQQPTPGVALET